MANWRMIEFFAIQYTVSTYSGMQNPKVACLVRSDWILKKNTANPSCHSPDSVPRVPHTVTSRWDLRGWVAGET
jgi:hypothetical protein